MWGYDVGVRISEITAPENGCTDHNVRAHEIGFLLSTPIQDDGRTTFRLGGGDKRLDKQKAGKIVMCDVQASSHKMGSLKKRSSSEDAARRNRSGWTTYSSGALRLISLVPTRSFHVLRSVHQAAGSSSQGRWFGRH